jgi:hypothetical protein
MHDAAIQGVSAPSSLLEQNSPVTASLIICKSRTDHKCCEMVPKSVLPYLNVLSYLNVRHLKHCYQLINLWMMLNVKSHRRH